MDGVRPGGTIIAEGMSGGISTPTILSPPNGMVEVSTTPIFTSSPFVGVSSDSGATHIFSIWEIALTPDFTDLVYFTGTDSTALTTLDLAVKGVTLETGVTYYTHVKYGSSTGKVSEWSPTLVITTEAYSTLLQTGKIVAQTAVSGAYFGYATDLSDDGSILVVGAQGDNYRVSNGGSASVVRKQGDSWITEDILAPADLSSGDYHGYRVAISGDGRVIAVSSPLDTHSATQAGSVYLYRYQNNSWSEVQKIVGVDPAYLDRIGVALDLSYDGSVLAIGAGWRNHHERYDSGCVLIYRYNGYVWDFEAELGDDTAENYAYLGRAVAISSDGNTVVAGAAYSDAMGAESGTAYIFQLGDSGWELNSRFNAPDAKPSMYFGESVAISGDGTRVAIGATWGTGRDVTTGAVYCYEQVEGTWVHVTKVYDENGQNGDYFGIAVALSGSGSHMAVSAYTDNGRGSREGSVMRYRWNGQQVEYHTKHTASDGEGWDEFGASVSLSSNGNIMAIGSPQDDDAGASSGAVYIYS